MAYIFQTVRPIAVRKEIKDEVRAELAAQFAPLAKQLTENEKKIVEELNAVQGKPVDIGGYYMPDQAKLAAIMRPSATFNAALAAVKA